MFEEIIGENANEIMEQVEPKQEKATVVADSILSDEGRTIVWQALLGKQKETGE